MRHLYSLLGEEFYTAKAHDIYHIPYDMLKFGSSVNCDTGKSLLEPWFDLQPTAPPSVPDQLPALLRTI
jgi:hypothetical protein